MKKVVIIDYGMGNLDSVRRAIEECGGTPIISCEKQEINQASHIVLPGVGSFADGMRNICQRGLDEWLTERALQQGIPLLGICLGMQLMAQKGLEGGETTGLAWLDAKVEKLQATSAEKRIPHIGWNEVHVSVSSPLFKGIDSGKDFYFVHSYHLVARDPDLAAATTPYCGQFISAIAKDNLFGVQFHPEKSQKVGFKLLRNFISL